MKQNLGRAGNAQPIKEVVEALLKKTGLYKKARSQMALTIWPRVVGDDVSKNTVPVAVKGGVLFVAVKNHVWANELVFLKREIINAINSQLQEQSITDIKFYVRWDLDRTSDSSRSMAEGIDETSESKCLESTGASWADCAEIDADEEMASICGQFADESVREMVRRMLSIGIRAYRARRLEDE